MALVPLATLGAQEKVNMNPSRPTVANSSSVPSKGLLQVEIGYDAYPPGRAGEQQTVDTSLFYTPLTRLRLDLTWSTLAETKGPDASAVGVGTVQLGGKVLLMRDRKRRGVPGVAIQYEAELPSASEEALQGYGQQAILLVNHHVGPFDLIVNGSVVQADCQTVRGCMIGGQQAAAVSYHSGPNTSLYAETFAQNVSQSNSPPGTYVFGGFLHRFSDTFGIDGGLRFGVTDGSARFGTTVGVVFGRRVGGGR